MSDEPRDRPARLLRLPSSKKRIGAELDEEFQFHVQGRIDQLMASGLSREEAEAKVMKRFGDVAAHRRDTLRIDEAGMRRMRLGEWLGALRRETGRSLRTLSRTPSFSVIAIVTLALGIGASTAIFTVLDRVVLRPLDYPEPERLVSVLHPATVPGSGERKWGLSSGGYFHFSKNARTVERLGIYVMDGTVVTGDGEAEVVDGAMVTTSVFAVLRARPVLGRLFTAEEDQPDSTRYVVLGHAYWQRRFGGDPAVVGKLLQTTGRPYTILGVMQPGLGLPLPNPFSGAQSLNGVDVNLWFPLKLNPAGPHWNSHPYVGLGRLAPGQTVETAQREFAALHRQLPEIVPNAYSTKFMESYNFRIQAAPLRDSVLGPTLPRTLWMLFAAVLLVMGIAAANVANLFLVRFEARRHEVAVRTALGADRRHLALHYLAESLALCLAAAIVGLFLSYVTLRGVLLLAPSDTPRLSTVALGPASIAFAIGMMLLTAVIFGVVPAVRSRVDAMSLRDEGRASTATRSRRRVRDTLLVGQLAIALVLLSSAGLLLRSFSRLQQVSPGFDTTNTLAFDLQLPFSQYDTREKGLVFARTLEERIRALPGVESVGSATTVPLEGGYGTGCTVVWRAGQPYGPNEEPPCVSTPIVMPGYIDVLKIRVRGRTPGWSDVDGKTQAVVITEALGNRLWPGEDPIGRGINSNGAESTVWYEIVGVIPELRAEALDRPPTEAVFYAPTGFRPNQRNGALTGLTWLVRTAGPTPPTLATTIKAIVAELEPRAPFMDPRTMSRVRARSLSRTTFIMTMLGIAAAVALALSVVGTYGVVSYLVTQRRAELGVRLALGAPRGRVSRMVVVDSLQRGIVGAAIGVVAAVAVGRVLSTVLFEVAPADPLALGVAVLLLVGCAALAAFIPARRAARTDPLEALRR